MQIDWSTVATSLVTAAFVAMGLEYAAKPWLEVRKERLLEVHRLRRAAIRTIARAQVKFAQLESLFPTGERPELAPRPIREYAEELRGEINALGHDLTNHLADLPRFGDRISARILSAASGTVAGKTMPGQGLGSILLDARDHELLNLSTRLLEHGPRSLRGFASRVKAEVWLRAQPDVAADTSP